VQGLGARFALEVVFLIALAIGAGVAELSTSAIIVVMAAGWLLVCLFELALWAEGPRFPALHLRTETVEQEEEPAAVTEIREPDVPRRGRFRRRSRAASGEGA
jgi:hypothetical protein